MVSFAIGVCRLPHLGIRREVHLRRPARGRGNVEQVHYRVRS
jgi:hypothetical protein